MKYWQKKSLENKYCYGSHSTQARIMCKYFPNSIKGCNDIVTKRMMKRKAREVIKMKLIISEDYEKLVDNEGNVIAEGHKLDAEDVLFALGYKFEIEEE